MQLNFSSSTRFAPPAGALPAIGCLALFLVLTALLLRPVDDYDVWFARLAGRHVLELGAIPRHEFYVYPVLGEASQFAAWGFGLLLELTARICGETGVAIVNAALGAGALTLLFMAGRARQAVPVSIGLVALALPFIGLDLRLNYRPEATLYLALGASLWLLEKFLASGRIGWLYPLPAIAWLLAQFHTTPIFIAILYAVYIVELLFAGPRRPPKLWAGLAAIAAATVLLPALNPYGIERLTLLLPSFQLPSFQLPALLPAPAPPPGAAAPAAAPAGSPLVEYLPVLATEFKFHFLALAGVALGCLLRRRWSVADLLLLGGFGLLAYSHARNIGLFALAVYLPLVRALGSPRWARRRALAWGMAGVAWCGALALALSAHAWGSGLAKDAFPEKAAARIRGIADAARIGNFFHLGSYLAWTLGSRFTVLVDGHFLHASRADSLHDSLFRADPGWRQRLAADGVNIIVTPATLPYSGALIPLVGELAADPDWVLVEAEPAALLFLRRSLVAGRSDIVALGPDRLWAQVIEEADKVLQNYPDHAAARAARARAYAALQGGRN